MFKQEGNSQPGNMPVSKTPKKNRVVINPPQLEIRPWQIITRPNPNIQSDTKFKQVNHLSGIRDGCAGFRQRTPNMGLQLLEQNVRRNFEKNIRHEENRQRGVIFRSGRETQLRLESKNSGITDVNTMRQQDIKGQCASQNIKSRAHCPYRSKKASKYRTHKHGKMCQSILAINLRLVVFVSGGRSESSSEEGSRICAGPNASAPSFSEFKSVKANTRIVSKRSSHV